MSKQHTPNLELGLGFYENGDIQCITQGNRDIAYMAYPGEQGKKDGERIIKACNNHDRLVEALEETVRQLHLMAVLSNDDNVYRGDIDNSNMTCGRAKQLLTELKS